MPRDEQCEHVALAGSERDEPHGHLIVLSQDGTLSLVEATPAEFRLKGKLPGVLNGPECWALPALAGGKLYLRDGEQAVCLKLAD